MYGAYDWRGKKRKAKSLTKKNVNDDGTGSPSASSGDQGNPISPADGAGSRTGARMDYSKMTDEQWDAVTSYMHDDTSPEKRALAQQALGVRTVRAEKREGWVPVRTPFDGLALRGFGDIAAQRRSGPLPQATVDLLPRLCRAEDAALRLIRESPVYANAEPRSVAEHIVNLHGSTLYVDPAAAVKWWTEVVEREQKATGKRSKPSRTARRKRYTALAKRSRNESKPGRYPSNSVITVHSLGSDTPGKVEVSSIRGGNRAKGW